MPLDDLIGVELAAQERQGSLVLAVPVEVDRLLQRGHVGIRRVRLEPGVVDQPHPLELPHRDLLGGPARARSEDDRLERLAERLGELAQPGGDQRLEPQANMLGEPGRRAARTMKRALITGAIVAALVAAVGLVPGPDEDDERHLVRPIFDNSALPGKGGERALAGANVGKIGEGGNGDLLRLAARYRRAVLRPLRFLNHGALLFLKDGMSDYRLGIGC